MQPSSPEFAAAVVAPVRRPTATVTLGGVDRSGQVLDVQVTREVAGDLPEQATLFAGSYAGRGTVTLNGAAVQALHPFRAGAVSTGDRSLIGATSVIEMGVDGEDLPQLTGTVRLARHSSVTGRDGTVKVDVVDPVQSLRAPISFPQVGPVYTPTITTPPPLNVAGLLTHCLHACGIRITAAPTADTVLEVPMVGGAIPDRGAVKPWASAGFTGFIAGPGGAVTWSAPSGGGTYELEARTRAYSLDTLLADGTGWIISAWVLTSGSGADTIIQVATDQSLLPAAKAFTAELRVISNGDYEVSARGATFTTISNGAPTTASTTWHLFQAAVWRSGGTLFVQGRRDDTELGLASGARTFPAALPVAVFMSLGQAVQDVKIDRVNSGVSTWSTSGVPWRSSATFTPQASLTTTGPYFYVPPQVDGVDAWSVIKELAAAELAVVDFTETGTLRYRSQVDLLDNPTFSTRTFTAESEALDRARVTVTGESRRTDVTVRVAQPRWRLAPIGTDVGAPSFKLDRVLVCPPGTSTHILQGEDPIAWAEWDRFLIWANTGEAEVVAGVAFSSSGGTLVTANVTVSLARVDARRLRLTVVNSTGGTLTTTWPSNFGAYNPYGIRVGDPSLLLYSFGAVDLGESATTVTNGATPRSVLEVPGSVSFRQDVTYGTDLATLLLAALDEPGVTVDSLVVPGDPRVQPGDVVTVQTASGLVQPITARVIRVVRSLSTARGLTDTYTLRLL